MFRARTVLVLGAGAHAEVGMPMGADLLKMIARDVSWCDEDSRHDGFLLNELQKFAVTAGENPNLYIRAGERLAHAAERGMSIDNIIHSLEDRYIEHVGKIAIANAIIKAEGNCYISVKYNKNLETSRFNDCWLIRLSHLLFENRKISDLENIFDNISIINFNYDRCLESFLERTISRYYGSDVVVCQKIVSGLTVHRRYGSTGRLPWQCGDAPAVGFGEAGPPNIMEISKRIKTFTEGVTDDSAVKRLQEDIEGADRIVFLGFAFHRQNVELLRTSIKSTTEVIGTTLGVSMPDCEVITAEIAEAFGISATEAPKRIRLVPTTCGDLFRDYWRTLTAEPRTGAGKSK